MALLIAAYGRARADDTALGLAHAGADIPGALDAIASGSPFASSAVDRAGHSLLAYHDGTAGGLRLAVETVVGWKNLLLDADPHAGTFSALGVDSAGTVCVAYATGERGELRLARVGATGTAREVIDRANGHFLGAFVQLAVAPDGDLVVQYADLTSGECKQALHHRDQWIVSVLDRAAFGSAADSASSRHRMAEVTAASVPPDRIEVASVPLEFRLSALAPHPARAGAPLALHLAVPRRAAIGVELFTANGRLADRRPVEIVTQPGMHVLSWMPRHLSAGTYFVRVLADGVAVAHDRWIFLR